MLPWWWRDIRHWPVATLSAALHSYLVQGGKEIVGYSAHVVHTTHTLGRGRRCMCHSCCMSRTCPQCVDEPVWERSCTCMIWCSIHVQTEQYNPWDFVKNRQMWSTTLNIIMCRVSHSLLRIKHMYALWGSSWRPQVPHLHASVWPGTLTNILEMLPTSVARYSVIHSCIIEHKKTIWLVQIAGKTSLTSKMLKLRC